MNGNFTKKRPVREEQHFDAELFDYLSLPTDSTGLVPEEYRARAAKLKKRLDARRGQYR